MLARVLLILVIAVTGCGKIKSTSQGNPGVTSTGNSANGSATLSSGSPDQNSGTTTPPPPSSGGGDGTGIGIRPGAYYSLDDSFKCQTSTGSVIRSWRDVIVPGGPTGVQSAGTLCKTVYTPVTVSAIEFYPHTKDYFGYNANIYAYSMQIPGFTNPKATYVETICGGQSVDPVILTSFDQTTRTETLYDGTSSVNTQVSYLLAPGGIKYFNSPDTLNLFVSLSIISSIHFPGTLSGTLNGISYDEPSLRCRSLR